MKIEQRKAIYKAKLERARRAVAAAAVASRSEYGAAQDRYVFAENAVLSIPVAETLRQRDIDSLIVRFEKDATSDDPKTWTLQTKGGVAPWRSIVQSDDRERLESYGATLDIEWRVVRRRRNPERAIENGRGGLRRAGIKFWETKR